MENGEEKGVAAHRTVGTKNEVVLRIPESENIISYSPQQKGSPSKAFVDSSNVELAAELQSLKNSSTVQSPTATTSTRSVGRSEFSKPKSRLVEPPHPIAASFLEDKTQIKSFKSPARTSTSKKTTPNATPPRDVPITPRTPLIGTPMEEEEEEEEEFYKTTNVEVSKKRSGKRWKFLCMIEWVGFVSVVGFLIVSLAIKRLRNSEIWGLELWKWCVLALVILCGRLVTGWFINVMVFLIERNFLFKKKVLYFVYGVKKSVQAFLWLGIVLMAWGLIFNHGIKRSRRVNRVLDYITRSLASCLIGAALWLAKMLLIKLLASHFQSARFFNRIQESIFHQYILRTLSGPPLMEIAENVGKNSSSSRLSFKTLVRENGNEEKKEEVIDVDKLKKMKQEKVSALTMKGLINVIKSSGLTTILPQSVDEDENEQIDSEITSELEAKKAAYRIFSNVAKPGSKYIQKEDLLRFMTNEEVENLLPLFEGAVATGRIKRKSLKNWLVKVYQERQSLVHSLNDTKTAVDDLNLLASVLIIIVIIIVWLLIMGFLTTHVLLFITSQLLLAVFIFGNSAKTVFEAIIFVFVRHPFDVGDRCVIDGVQMTVEEMNILTTIFLRYDNEKISYPNSVLANKPISNFYRSPEMSESIEFSVDMSTPIESIAALKSRIKSYLESKPQHWGPNHSVVVKDIENVDKMKMGLNVNHTINFQNYGDKSSRRSELLLELKKMLEDIKIKYHLLPQEVHLSYVNSENSTKQTVWR